MFDYSQLARFILPEGLFDNFEITRIEESRTGEVDEAGFEVRTLNIWLDERDHRQKDQKNLRPNGFTEPRSVSDFPIRDHKAVLHIRRRRWLDENGKAVPPSEFPLVAKGSGFSPEFAAFLKGAFGQTPDVSPTPWAVIQSQWKVFGKGL